MTNQETELQASPSGQRSRRLPRASLPYLVLALFAYVPSLLARPGWVAADTKAYLYLNPSKLMSSAWSMWNPDVGLGTVTHQNIGYLFPMGPYYWAMSGLGVPNWIAQRLWMGTLFFAAGAGAYFLCRLLTFRRSGALSAAFIYMFTPFVIDYITRISAITMPWAALGWMLAFTILSLRKGGWRYPALFALCVAFVGGVNATSILFVGLAPALYLLYAVFNTNETSARVALRVVGKLGLLTTAVSLWWIAGLWAEGAYGINILKFTETIPTVTSTSLASEAFRGLGYWFFYGRDSSEPWTAAAAPYVSSYWAIGLSIAVPATCLLAGFFVKWRYRAFAAWLVVLGIALAVAAYPLNKPTPFGSALKVTAESSTIGLAMRSSNRVLPIAVLGLALMLGAFVSAIRLRNRKLGLLLLGGTVIAASLNLSPLFDGSIVSKNMARHTEALPKYVNKAAAYLNSHHQSSNVLGVPGEDFAYYTFGTTADPIWPALLERPYVGRQAVVQGEPGSINLLRALDEDLQNGTIPSEAMAPIASLMGSGDLLLQSNLPTNRYGLNQPQIMYLNKFLPTPLGLEGPVAFGNPAEVAAIKRKVFGPDDLAVAPGSPYPAPLLVYGVPHPRKMVRIESSSVPLLVAGDGQGLVQMAALGLVPIDTAITYSGAVVAKSPALSSALRNDATLVITDSNIRSLDSWGTLNSTFGYPMTANEVPLVANPAQQSLPLFKNRSSDLQTVAFYPGISQMTATSYGNPITNNPEQQPSNAFDGDPTTAWIEGAYQPAIHQSILLSISHKVSADHLTLLQPAAEDSGLRHVKKITIHLDNFTKKVTLKKSSIAVRGQDSPGQTISFPMKSFRHLTITIDATNEPGLKDFSAANAIGFAEISVTGLTPIHESLRMPIDLTNKVGTSAINHRMVIVSNRLVLPRHGLSRAVYLPNAREFSVGGILRANRDATDPTMNALLGRTGNASTSAPTVIGTDSTSRLASNVNAGSWSAIDGKAETAWVPDVSTKNGQSMTVNLSKSISVDHLNMELVNDGHHGLPSLISLSNGLQTVTVPMPGIPPPASSENGSTSAVTVELPTTLTGKTFTLTIVKKVAPKIIDFSAFGPTSLPIGIAELGLPGVVAPKTPDTVDLSCNTEVLFVNGTPVPVTAHGSVADLIGGKGLRFTGCSPSTSFNKGLNQIESVQTSNIGVTADLVGFGSDIGGGPLPQNDAEFQLPAAPAATHVKLTSQSRTSLNGTFIGTGAPGTLVLGQSLSSGWKLAIDGKEVTHTPRLVDGFANGWDLPAFSLGKKHTVALTWTPQTVVNWSVYASMVGFVVVLGLAILPRRRRRLTDQNEADEEATLPTLLSRSVGIKEIGRPSIVTCVVVVVIATLCTSWLAIVPLAVLAVLLLTLRIGRLLSLLAAATGLVLAAGSMVAQAHKWPWNILWPQHFGLANGAIWASLAVLLVDATIERSASRSTDRWGPRDPSDDRFPTSDDDSSGLSDLDPLPLRSPLATLAVSTVGSDLEGTEPSIQPLSNESALAPGETAFVPGPVAPSAPAVGMVAAAGLAARKAFDVPDVNDQVQAVDYTDVEERPTTIPTGLRRSIALFQAFKVEQTDPDRFYRTLAEDTANQLAVFTPLFNRTIVDVGGGPGYFSEAFEARGARVLLVEPEARPVEVRPVDQPFASFEERHEYAVKPGRLHQQRTIAGDGVRLPFADDSIDIAFSSNVLEHVPDPKAFLDEALRVTKPNGTVYCSFTVWSSPWGGHETSPWHLFGGNYAARRYERKHGRPPGNLFGSSLFKVRVADALKLVKAREDVSLVWAFPRYYPEWAAWIIKVPVVREFVTWNLLLVLRKDVEVSEPRVAEPPMQGLRRPVQPSDPN